MGHQFESWNLLLHDETRAHYNSHSYCERKSFQLSLDICRYKFHEGKYSL